MFKCLYDAIPASTYSIAVSKNCLLKSGNKELKLDFLFYKIHIRDIYLYLIYHS